MLKLLIVADDLTGANDTGAMLAGLGYAAAASPTPEVFPGLLAGREVLSINADSRALPKDQAYARVRGLVERFYPGPEAVLSKRIDSTLRGNLGAELDAVLDVLPPGARAAVVSASPAAGRICAGGAVLVHGVPLLETGLVHDPRTPVQSCFVGRAIAAQSRREQAHIGLDAVTQGPEAIGQALRATEAPVLVFDACTDQHLSSIAQALLESGLSFACFDPGPFTLALTRARFPKPRPKEGTALVVVGSRTVESRRQVAFLLEKGGFAHHACDLQALLADPVAEAGRALAFFASQPEGTGLVLSTVEAPQLHGRAAEVCQRLCECAVQVLAARRDVSRCYLSGGDIARGFLEQAGAKGVDLVCELLPLAVCGRLVGGRFDGLLLLTKGGMIGGPDAIFQMLEKSSAL